jgi:hypothetical protein
MNFPPLFHRATNRRLFPELAPVRRPRPEQQVIISLPECVLHLRGPKLTASERRTMHAAMEALVTGTTIGLIIPPGWTAEFRTDVANVPPQPRVGGDILDPPAVAKDGG